MNPTEKNRVAVLFTLAMAQSPLTVDDLSKRTGKSYNTVKKVLKSEQRVQKVGHYPARYYLSKPEEIDSELVRVTGEQPKEGWVPWLDKVRPKIVRLTEIDSTAHTKDVRNQGLVLEALGTNLLSLGRTMQRVSDEPNWYELIGGTDGIDN